MNKEFILEGHNTTLHDGGVACMAIEDPNLVYAISSERVTRVKHDGSSQSALDYLGERLSRKGYSFDNKRGKFDPEYREFQDLHHHLAHAAGAYYPSGFDNAAVLVIDGQGGYNTEGICASTSIWRGDNEALDLIEVYKEPDIATQSIGHLYSVISYYVGFDFLQEGKTMGLAAYGENSNMTNFLSRYVTQYQDGSYEIHPKFIRAMIYLTEGRKIFKLEDSTPGNDTLRVMQDIQDNIGLPRRQGDPITERDTNLAWAGQHTIERLIFGLADRAKNLTGSQNLCYAGGVALNSVANGKLAESGMFHDMFIFPPAGDEGQALGRLFQRAYSEYAIPRTYTMENAYLGPEYDEQEIDDLVKRNLEFIQPKKLEEDDLLRLTAQSIADGNVVGWWQGRSEVGPRGLGNRSILADPRRETMRDYVNSRVKHREWFRPLAPSVTQEAVGEYFESDRVNPFMLLTTNVHPDKQLVIPAVTHVDGSARLQTVRKEDNHLYHDLIGEFGRITGVPVLLNTSFNDAGEPIVETPQDALSSFLGMRIDNLVLGNYFITKD